MKILAGILFSLLQPWVAKQVKVIEDYTNGDFRMCPLAMLMG